jgi:hypothetical protein
MVGTCVIEMCGRFEERFYLVSHKDGGGWFLQNVGMFFTTVYDVIRAEVKERVEIYFYSPSGALWSVLWRKLIIRDLKCQKVLVSEIQFFTNT